MTPVDGCLVRRRAPTSNPPDDLLASLDSWDDIEQAVAHSTPAPRKDEATSERAIVPAPIRQALAGDEPPLSQDLTPAPVVIRLGEQTDSAKIAKFAPAKESVSSPWHEPNAKNTPAEPVASVRVRQLFKEREQSRQDEQALPPTTNICDDRVVTAVELTPAAQYVPPMRPPESIPGHVASQPKVEVVPDCDTRVRTARSLRRQSSIPPAVGKVLGLAQGWPLYAAVALTTCVVAIGIVRNFSHGSHGSHGDPSTSGSSVPIALPAQPKVAPPGSPQHMTGANDSLRQDAGTSPNDTNRGPEQDNVGSAKSKSKSANSQAPDSVPTTHSSGTLVF